MDGVDASPPDVASAPAFEATPPEAPAAAEPATPDAAPAGPADGFGANPQEENGAKFAQAFGPDAPAADPALAKDPAANPAEKVSTEAAKDPNADAQARERVSQAVDDALKNVPGLSDQDKAKIRDGFLSTADGVSKFLKVGLDRLEKGDLSFNVNGSIVNGGLSGTVFPKDKQGNFDASLGLSTPNLPGASVAASLTFRMGHGITPEGTPSAAGVVNGEIPGLGGVTFKGSTDGTFTVQRDIPGLTVGGGVPNAGVEVNVPINDTVKKLTGTDEQSLRLQAGNMTADDLRKSAASYDQRYQATNANYDRMIAAEPDAVRKQVLDQERNGKLQLLQKNQVVLDQLLTNMGRTRLEALH